jgi:hypothetical protein
MASIGSPSRPNRDTVADRDLDQPPEAGLEHTAGDGRPYPLANRAGRFERRLWQQHHFLYPRDRTVA